MNRTIKGEKNNSGMLEKVNDLNEWIDIESITIDKPDGDKKTVTRKVQKYQYAGNLFKQLPASDGIRLDCILFQTVATIDREKAGILNREWRAKEEQCSSIAEDTEESR
jgi:hypothetical protein